MKKFSAFAAVLALLAGAAAMMRSDRASESAAAKSVMLAGSAPFRDGLYLGRLAARHHAPMHIASGRWATAADRNLFVAGFRHGYQDQQATQASLPVTHEAE